jgi:Cytochrome c7 and related cytochrome c
MGLRALESPGHEGESAYLDDLQEPGNMKKLASLFVAVAVLFATNALAAVPSAPIKLDAKTGAVTFKHDTHKSLKCTVCHKDEKGGPIEGLGKSMNKDKAHAACHECHKKEAKGPQKCGECHKKA